MWLRSGPAGDESGGILPGRGCDAFAFLQIFRPDDGHDVAGAAAQPGVDREEAASRRPCERDVLGVIRLHPAEFLGDAPRFAAQPLRAARRHGRCEQPLERNVARPAEISFRQRISCNADDTSDRGAGAMRCSRPNRPKPSAARQAWTADGWRQHDHAISALRANGGRHGRRPASAHRSQSRPRRGQATLRRRDERRRSDSSMRCCVPARRDRSRPDRIQRRTVSGLQRTRRAASGTVSIGVAYYNSSARRPWTAVRTGRSRSTRGRRSIPGLGPDSSTGEPVDTARPFVIRPRLDGSPGPDRRPPEESPDWDTSTSTRRRPQGAAQQSSHRAPPLRLQ